MIDFLAVVLPKEKQRTVANLWQFAISYRENVAANTGIR